MKNKFFTRQFVSARCLTQSCFMRKKQRRNGELYGFSYRMSVSRGTVISGILICILPAVVGADAIWFAMPITELLVAIYVTIRMTQYTKAISVESGMR